MQTQLLALGMRLKAARRERAMTLQTLTEETGLTAGLLSKIENARSVPSLPVLFLIARTLQLDLAALFEGMEVAGDARWLLVRASDQRPVEREESRGFAYRMILEREIAAADLQVLLLTVAPGGVRPLASSEGDELIYLLSGRLRFQLGEEFVDLEPGDTLFFDGALPHVPYNESSEAASLLAFYFVKR